MSRLHLFLPAVSVMLVASSPMETADSLEPKGVEAVEDAEVSRGVREANETPQTNKTEMEVLQEQVAALNETLVRLQQRLDVAVVVSAKRHEAFFSATAPNETLKFDLIQTNHQTGSDHGAYDSSKGIFTAPYNGFYVCHATLSCIGTGFYIVLDGIDKVASAVPTHGVAGAQQLTVSAALLLPAGHTVSVSPHTDIVPSQSGPAIRAENESIFVCYLLHRLA